MAWYLILGFSIPLCCAVGQPDTTNKAPVNPVLEQLHLVNPPAMRLQDNCIGK